MKTEFKKLLPALITALTILSANVSVIFLGKDNIVEEVAQVILSNVDQACKLIDP